MHIEPIFTNDIELFDYYGPYDDFDFDDDYPFYFDEDDDLDDDYDRYVSRPVGRPRPGRPYPRPPRRPRPYPWRPWYPWGPRPWRPRPIRPFFPWRPFYPWSPWDLSPIGFLAGQLIDEIIY